MSEAVLEARGLRKVFHDGANELVVLDGLDLAVAPQEAVAILGRSGTGKTTLLHLLGLLDHPTSGEIVVEGRSAAGFDERARTRLRGRHIGFVFQHFHLLPDFDALENVRLAGQVSGRDDRYRAEELLGLVGLSERLHHKPKQLSGGEQQRVAIARALMPEPPLLLCDEPTGNLDPSTGLQIMDVLQEAARKRGTALILVTHDEQVAARAGRVLRLENGRLHNAG